MSKILVELTEAAMPNLKQILAGHGIQSTLRKQLETRPDVIYKLFNVLLKTKYGKKKVLSLKKNYGFRIYGYKNWATYATNADADLEAFTATLKDEDNATFVGKENAITMLVAPGSNYDATLPLSEQPEVLKNGVSQLRSIETSISKGYKVDGCYYFMVCFADSIILPKEARIAQKKAKVNERKAKRRTASKLRTALKAKISKAKTSKRKAQKSIQALQARAQMIDGYDRPTRRASQQVIAGEAKDLAKLKKNYSKILAKRRELDRETPRGARMYKTYTDKLRTMRDEIKLLQERADYYAGDSLKTPQLNRLRKARKTIGKDLQRYRGKAAKHQQVIERLTSRIAGLTPAQKQQVAQQVAQEVTELDTPADVKQKVQEVVKKSRRDPGYMQRRNLSSKLTNLVKKYPTQMTRINWVALAEAILRSDVKDSIDPRNPNTWTTGNPVYDLAFIDYVKDKIDSGKIKLISAASIVKCALDYWNAGGRKMFMPDAVFQEIVERIEFEG